MWLKRLFCALLVLFCLQAVVAQDELTSRYLSIRDKLMNMKTNSEIVTERLKTVTEQLNQQSESLKLSQQEAKEWEQTSMTLSESLTNINEQLNDAYLDLEHEHMKNKQLTKALFILIGVLVLLILTVGLVLYLELTHKTNFI